MKEIAIIGTTASGKTGLALEIASKTNAIILSLDSLSVYKNIDIASAKPTIQERGDIVHFGINEVYPNEVFDVLEFIACYKKAKAYAQEHNKNLIIVGGTSFYLKILIEGISLGVTSHEPLNIPTQEAYEFLYAHDAAYMQKIQKNDAYRVEKAYNIYQQTKLTPSEYFLQNPKKPFVEKLPIFEIVWEVDVLRQRIFLRTQQMLKMGLIDEVIALEKHYSRLPNCMSSIGIIETLSYLDGQLTKTQLEQRVTINTSQLAKRQRTFNNSQFGNLPIKKPLGELNSEILKIF